MPELRLEVGIKNFDSLVSMLYSATLFPIMFITLIFAIFASFAMENLTIDALSEGSGKALCKMFLGAFATSLMPVVKA